MKLSESEKILLQLHRLGYSILSTDIFDFIAIMGHKKYGIWYDKTLKEATFYDMRTDEYFKGSEILKEKT